MKQLVKKMLFGEKGIITIRLGMARGIKMTLDPQHASQMILGLAEAEIAPLFKRCAKQSDTFFDIGAASGYYSLVFRKYNTSGLIFMFDANSVFLQIQQDNLARNDGRQQVEQFDLYVSEHVGDGCISIDHLIDSRDIRDGTLLFKIDVDGGELDVLSGMKNTLDQMTCHVIVETHSLELEKQCVAFLTQLGYQVDIIRNAWWRFLIKENRPIPHNRWLYAVKTDIH